MNAIRRRSVWLLAALLVLLAGVVAGLVALPEVVRRVAVTRLTAMTGRTVRLDDVDLNVFTGRVALKGFRLAQRDGPEAAVAIERLDVGVSLPALLFKHARVTELAVQAPVIRVARTGPATFDFSDLLALIPPSDPAKPPSAWIVTLDHIAVRGLRLVARDLVPSPPAEWVLEDFELEGSGVSTGASAAPGRLALKGRLNGARLAIDVPAVRAAKGAVTARLTLDDFALAPLAPYLPPDVAALPRAGRLAIALSAAVERGADGAPRGEVSGDVRVADLALTRRDRHEPFLAATRVAVAIKRVDVATRAVALGTVEVTGLALAGVRSHSGDIDLLQLAARPAPAATPVVAAPVTPAAAAAGPAAPAMTVSIERVALTDASVTFTDEAVTPVTTLQVTRLSASVRDVTWPVTGPATLEAALKLPAAGDLTVKGAVTAQPLDADLTLSLRGASIDPYGAYFPFPARFSGSFNGDSHWRVRIADGALTAASTGDSWIDNLSARAADAPPGAPPAVRSDRLALNGIDFDWPKHARVKRVTVTRPDVRIEREKDGTISLRRIFTPVEAAPAAAGATVPAAAPAKPAPPRSPTGPIALDIGAIVIDNGFVRFVDRTTQPAYAESISKLAVMVEGLSSTPGKKASVTVRAVVGGEGALDIRGTIAPFGRLYADVGLELRDFALPAVTPYVDNLLAWSIERGQLVARLHYTIDGDALTAQNDITIGGLEVKRSAAEDGAKRRLGLPLGLVVALIKDGQGRIRVNVPISGHLNDPKFDLSDAIWTAIRNVVVNVVAAPFRAIGRLFTADDKKIETLAVEPVIFEPGSATLTPEMDRHLLRVGDFLRGAPAVTLALAPAVTTRDADRLRAETLAARLRTLQREQKLPDYAAAVAAEFRARFPGESSAPATEEQLARLTALEPLDEARLAELRARRLAVVREALTGAGGVTAARLTSAETAPATDTGDGRVDFSVGP